MLTEEKAASAKREASEANKVRASETKQEFQRQERHANVAMDDAEHSMKKLEPTSKWLTTIHKWMTDAHQQEIQVTEKATSKIANLKESLGADIADTSEDARTRVYWLWDELSSAREENK